MYSVDFQRVIIDDDDLIEGTNHDLISQGTKTPTLAFLDVDGGIGLIKLKFSIMM